MFCSLSEKIFYLIIKGKIKCVVFKKNIPVLYKKYIDSESLYIINEYNGISIIIYRDKRNIQNIELPMSLINVKETLRLHGYSLKLILDGNVVKNNIFIL